MTLDPRALRAAFGAFLTGVTVVTTRDAAGAPIGFTANSFASVSLDPPLLLVCLANRSANYATLTAAPGFAVNILAETQAEISNTFARPVADRFAAIDWRLGPVGSPVLAGVAAWFDCATDKIIEAGDHAILIGRVEAFENGVANGLGYARGGYFTPTAAEQAVAAARHGVVTVASVIARDGAVLLVGPEGGPYALPDCPIDQAEGPGALQGFLLRATRLPTSVGLTYSVYESRATGAQHIVYRCNAGPGTPSAGRFVALTDLPLDRIADAPTRDILRRFAAESALGNFGVYFGNEQTGRIHPLGRKD